VHSPSLRTKYSWLAGVILVGIVLVGSVRISLWLPTPNHKTLSHQPAKTITVNWDSIQQAIDGFGAASGGSTNKLTTSLQGFFFTNQGIHLSFVRLMIYPDLTDCVKDSAPGQCVTVQSGATLTLSDLANAQVAYEDGAKVWAAEWSPPGAMKSNGDFETGGSMLNGTGNANFTSLATIQASFVALMSRTYGIPIYAVSPQNEPNISTVYPSCTWTAQQLHDYVPYLHSALASAGYSSTRIVLGEASLWNTNYNAKAMDDIHVSDDISFLAAHIHGQLHSASLLSWNNLTMQHVWQTEAADENVYDGTIASALSYATSIHDYLTVARVSMWSYWLLSCYMRCTNNEGLTDNSNNLPKRAYAVGNYSRFVQPGWVRVGVTNRGALLVTAFQNASGTRHAIVVVNNSGSAVADQVFSVSTNMGSSVIPWVTSSTQSLANQPTVSISSGSFTYTIPADSVVSFVEPSDLS
jgi:glucuronoarabinoxylan endo-1,4-beta-xylanase